MNRSRDHDQTAEERLCVSRSRIIIPGSWPENFYTSIVVARAHCLRNCSTQDKRLYERIRTQTRTSRIRDQQVVQLAKALQLGVEDDATYSIVGSHLWKTEQMQLVVFDHDNKTPRFVYHEDNGSACSTAAPLQVL
jgi:hypothetical protein